MHPLTRVQRNCSIWAVIRSAIAGSCILGMMLMHTPALGQNPANPPAEQASPVQQDIVPSVDPNAAKPIPPVPSSLSLAEKPLAKPPDMLPGREKVLEALLKDNFSYNQNKMVDPFVSFVAPTQSAPPPVTGSEEDFEPPPEPQRPLTPLQKMNLGEIERGLKAIAWGELGRRAIVEDSAGKGYIVSVGTPAGERNGVITEIFNDRIVIQQEFWDRKAGRMIPQNSVVKLKKEKDRP
jgi:Tfp pilus assembly protein PilP